MIPLGTWTSPVRNTVNDIDNFLISALVTWSNILDVKILTGADIDSGHGQNKS